MRSHAFRRLPHAHSLPSAGSRSVAGDFLVLLHSGYSKREAFAYNVLSGVAMLLGIAAASMIYVSVADLIPGLHEKRDLPATLQQALLILAGIATVGIVSAIAHSVVDV